MEFSVWSHVCQSESRIVYFIAQQRCNCIEAESVTSHLYYLFSNVHHQTSSYMGNVQQILYNSGALNSTTLINKNRKYRLKMFSWLMGSITPGTVLRTTFTWPWIKYVTGIKVVSKLGRNFYSYVAMIVRNCVNIK